MSYEQAENLAKGIQEEFPHTEALIVQSVDMRNAPRNFFVAVSRQNEQEGRSLHIHSMYEWETALDALHVLRA